MGEDLGAAWPRDIEPAAWVPYATYQPVDGTLGYGFKICFCNQIQYDRNT